MQCSHFEQVHHRRGICAATSQVGSAFLLIRLDVDLAEERQLLRNDGSKKTTYYESMNLGAMIEAWQI